MDKFCGLKRAGQHLEERRGGTSRGDARCAQHAARSISSVAAASAPSQQQHVLTAGDGSSVPRPALLGSPSIG